MPPPHLHPTTLHPPSTAQEYVAVVENQLEDFCKKHSTRSDEVFYEVQVSVSQKTGLELDVGLGRPGSELKGSQFALVF